MSLITFSNLFLDLSNTKKPTLSILCNTGKRQILCSILEGETLWQI